MCVELSAEPKQNCKKWKQWKTECKWKLPEENEFNITIRIQNAPSKHGFWITLQCIPIYSNLLGVSKLPLNCLKHASSSLGILCKGVIS